MLQGAGLAIADAFKVHIFFNMKFGLLMMVVVGIRFIKYYCQFSSLYRWSTSNGYYSCCYYN